MSDETVFFTMGEDRAGYLVERGPTSEDLHQPEEPADRGLRLGPVRLSEDPCDEQLSDNDAAEVDDILGRADATEASAIDRRRARLRHPSREKLDREMREIKDDVLRMGVLRRVADPGGDEALVAHDADAAHDGHRRGRPHQRDAARDHRPDPTDDRDPAAGRPRPALPALPRPRHATSSSGWATTPHRSPSRPASSPRIRRSRPYVDLPAMGELDRDARAGHPPGARRHRRGRRPRRRGPRRRGRRALPPRSSRDVAAHARRPGQRRARARGSCSRPTTSSGSATGSRTSPRTSCSWPAARSRTSTREPTRI